MAEKLKLVSGRDTVNKFVRAGWTIARQRGSHIMLVKPGFEWTLSVPDHRQLGSGLLRKLVRQAGLTVEEFNRL